MKPRTPDATDTRRAAALYLAALLTLLANDAAVLRVRKCLALETP